MRPLRKKERRLHATLLHLETVADNSHHSAFTSICQWRGTWYVAYRVARTHGIVPPGFLQVCQSASAAPHTWYPQAQLTHPVGDLRDPKLIPTEEALYCLAGVYLAHPAREGGPHSLSNSSHENLLHTLLCYTTDGATWSPWVPILRPQYWGWSVIRLGDVWVCAAYHCGQPGEPQSLVLWTGKSLLTLAPIGTMYEGMSQEREGRGKAALYRYPSLHPSEAILYHPTPRTLGCLVRTNAQMEVGVSHASSSFQDWRWSPLALEVKAQHRTASPAFLHPSGLLQTPQGWVLAARYCQPVFRTHTIVERYSYSTRLFHLEARVAREILVLPSAGDCGYAEICQGPAEHSYLVSFYAQTAVPSSLPRAAVSVATVRLED